MIKYAKIVDFEAGTCEVGIGTADEFYQSLGMELMDVEQSENGMWYLAGKVPPPVITQDDYDRAMEDYIYNARVARGYTLREPDVYKDSSVPRWRQDALDFIAFRDSCLLYGQSVINTYTRSGEVPTLE